MACRWRSPSCGTSATSDRVRSAQLSGDLGGVRQFEERRMARHKRRVVLGKPPLQMRQVGVAILQPAKPPAEPDAADHRTGIVRQERLLASEGLVHRTKVTALLAQLNEKIQQSLAVSHRRGFQRTLGFG